MEQGPWLTCAQFVELTRSELGEAAHEGHTMREELLDRAASKLRLSIRLRRREGAPQSSPDVQVFADAGLALEGNYAEALLWVMRGAPDAQARALARAEARELSEGSATQARGRGERGRL